MAQSLPIPIGPLGSGRPQHGLPPFRKGSAGGSDVARSYDKVSAEAMRRASYRERDRKRSIDPGALDFDFEDDVEDELDTIPENEEPTVGKSMQRALNILQKHSEIPGAGKQYYMSHSSHAADPSFRHVAQSGVRRMWTMPQQLILYKPI